MKKTKENFGLSIQMDHPPRRAEVVITSPEEDVLKYEVQLKFPITNNKAENRSST